MLLNVEQRSQMASGCHKYRSNMWRKTWKSEKDTVVESLHTSWLPAQCHDPGLEATGGRVLVTVKCDCR